MKTEVIIVAAGAGRRLKSKIPKALVPLFGRPLITHSLKVFEQTPGIRGIIIVGPQGHLSPFVRACRPFKKVRAIVAGGAMRADSVKSGLEALLSDTDIVLVHDAARPFVDKAMVTRLLAALRKAKAAITGVPVKFTVKKVDARSLIIKETPSRSLLWEAQTPQGFHKDILLKAHAKPFKGEATDDAMLVERLGIKVKIIEGSYRNIKITTPEDFKLAKLMQSK